MLSNSATKNNNNGDTDTITLLEVKNVVGADYPAGGVPKARSNVGAYEAAAGRPGEPYERAAIFPHGSHKPGIGVVSDRAIKHIHELTNLHGNIDEDGRTIQSAILFVVNRADCQYFRPAHECDMMFAQVLQRAHVRGVKLIAQEIVWEEEIAYLGRSLPIRFDRKVNEKDIDETHLQAVLDFNDSNPQKTSKALAGKKKSVK